MRCSRPIQPISRTCLANISTLPISTTTRAALPWCPLWIVTVWIMSCMTWRCWFRSSRTTIAVINRIISINSTESPGICPCGSPMSWIRYTTCAAFRCSSSFYTRSTSWIISSVTLPVTLLGREWSTRIMWVCWLCITWFTFGRLPSWRSSSCSLIKITCCTRSISPTIILVCITWLTIEITI